MLSARNSWASSSTISRCGMARVSAGGLSGIRSSCLTAELVNGEVELDHIDPGLTEESQGAALDVVGDQRTDGGGVEVARGGHPRGLLVGVRRGDVRVQPRGAGGEGVGR